MAEGAALAEAVIISGPRRGAIVALPEDERLWDPEVESMAAAVAAQAEGVAEKMRGLVQETEALLGQLRLARSDRHGTG